MLSDYATTVTLQAAYLKQRAKMMPDLASDIEGLVEMLDDAADAIWEANEEYDNHMRHRSEYFAILAAMVCNPDYDTEDPDGLATEAANVWRAGDYVWREKTLIKAKEASDE